MEINTMFQLWRSVFVARRVTNGNTNHVMNCNLNNTRDSHKKFITIYGPSSLIMSVENLKYWSTRLRLYIHVNIWIDWAKTLNNLRFVWPSCLICFVLSHRQSKEMTISSSTSSHTRELQPFHLKRRKKDQ